MSDAAPPTNGGPDLPPQHSYARALLELFAMLDPDGFPYEVAYGSYFALDHVRSAPWRDTDAGPLRRLARWLGVGSGGTLGAPEQSARDQLEKTGLLHAGTEGAARISRETRGSVLASLDYEAFQRVARIAADMLVDYWIMLDEEAYEAGQQRFGAEAEQLVIANTDTLVATAGEVLWRPEAHRVLFQQGYYLRELGDRERELAYWRDLLAETERILGPEHLSTSQLRADLGRAQRNSGNTAEAIAIHEAVLDHRLRELDHEHNDVLTSRSDLALTYRAAGRTDEAVTLLEETVAAAARAKTGSLTTDLIRDNLVDVYCGAGRYDDAVVQREEDVTQRTHRMGARHPYTLSARNSLGEVLHAAGRAEEAAAEYRAVVGACDAQNPSADLTVQEIRDEAAKGLADMGAKES
ncbi:tetratricopeptide (TPR) repeat protein [Lipingzhangella halophila]|uniref:Tetratricopeptide (TPR) repeat protein n=1 Tax=Lipingzhangella halophila TaxID=1783352 RepID=A0A7W7RC52_9ACTN|nr:tetratricopeptide repeat protein [Lipingzhangella halophila]MBB4929271.1 tetratricopeptide (TPR) repeat protein [Lipingzhangella halophila]